MAGDIMHRTRQTRKPTFLWQGLLIVLPVVALAGAGLFSLRQDKVLARLEATERAQAFADEFAQEIWTELTAPPEPGAPAFLVDDSGQLLFPPRYSPVPVPKPLNPVDLNEDQAALWRTALQAARNEQEAEVAIEALRKFLELAPPEAFAAAARFNLGVWLSRGGALAAADQFRMVAENFPDAIGETGLPLAPLAMVRSLELADLSALSQFPAVRTQTSSPGIASSKIAIPLPLLTALCSNAVFHPSPATPLLLDWPGRLNAARDYGPVARIWRAEWERHQLARALFAAARPHFQADHPASEARQPSAPSVLFATPARRLPKAQVPPLFWFTGPRDGGRPVPETDWLATRFEDRTNGHWLVCQPRLSVWSALVDERPKPDESMSIIAHFPSNQQTRWQVPPSIPSEEHPSRWAEARKRLPAYFGMSLDVAGMSLMPSNQLPILMGGHAGRPASFQWVAYSGPRHSPPPILASAKKVEGGVECLRCNIHLISPQMLFARQSQRSLLYGLLIAVSAGTALIGFRSARRAFVKQQRLAEMKTNFVSSVSHELRAPIASVRLMAESLERGKVGDPAKQREYFGFIVQECRRLSSLIVNVLDFARIEQGRKRYEFEPVDIVGLVRQTVKLMEPAAAEKQVMLAAELDDARLSALNPQPEVDGQAIQQALVNLIDNAIKHSPAGATVRVGLDFILHPSSFILFVEDAGPGIPASEHERIFERFYRSGSELRRETQGVGIGLSIVKHIVEAHGGRVTVRSEVGQGSRFEIELPMQGGGARVSRADAGLSPESSASNQ